MAIDAGASTSKKKPKSVKENCKEKKVKGTGAGRRMVCNPR